MIFDFALALDLLSPLALIAILSLGYGMIWQRLAGEALAPVHLGLTFGLVAMLQMQAPLRPVDGVIVDLRAIPVALAGAYLGTRGLAACLVVALAARWQIGGIGLWPDILGIATAGAAGFLWDRATRHHRTRGLDLLMGLALAMSASALAGGLLPHPLAGWMLTAAAPMVILVSLVAVPALATLLERERDAQRLDRDLLAASAAAGRTGWLTPAGFRAWLADLRAAEGTGPPVVAVLVLRIRPDRWLSGPRAAAVHGHVLGGLRDRLPGLLCHGDTPALTSGGDILVALTDGDAARVGPLLIALRRIAAARAIALPDGDSARISVAARLAPLGDAVTCADLAARLHGPGNARRAGFRPIPPASGTRAAPPHMALFARTAALCDRRHR